MQCTEERPDQAAIGSKTKQQGTLELGHRSDSSHKSDNNHRFGDQGSHRRRLRLGGGGAGAGVGAEVKRSSSTKDNQPPSNDNPRGPVEIGTRSRSRRALLGDFSDEDEEGDINPQNHQPPPMKGKSPLPQDYDIDMQLEDISPEHGGSSLQLSMSNDEFQAVPNQAATSRLDVTNLAATTPTTTSHKSPRKEATIDTHSAKRRRSETGRHMAISESIKSHNMKTKEAIPSIDIVLHMWLGFPIHEAIEGPRS